MIKNKICTHILCNFGHKYCPLDGSYVLTKNLLDGNRSI